MIVGWLGVAWAADTWFVPDPERAEEVRAAVDSAWPGREVEILVGLPAGATTWTRWDGSVLVQLGTDDLRTGTARDAVEAVLLARTWTLTTDPLPPETFVPEVLAAAPSPPPEPPPPSAIERRQPHPDRWKLALGLGARVGIAHPTDGMRLLTGLERHDTSLSVVAFLPIAADSQTRNARQTDPGRVWLVASDRWTVGLMAARDLGHGPVALRVGVGPELRRAVTSLSGVGLSGDFPTEGTTSGFTSTISPATTTTQATPVDPVPTEVFVGDTGNGSGSWAAALVAEVGATVGGRVQLVPTGFVRVSVLSGPWLEAGIATDLVFGPRPGARFSAFEAVDSPRDRARGVGGPERSRRSTPSRGK